MKQFDTKRRRIAGPIVWEKWFTGNSTILPNKPESKQENVTKETFLDFEIKIHILRKGMDSTILSPANLILMCDWNNFVPPL